MTAGGSTAVHYMRSPFSAICSDDAEVEVRCLVAFSLWIGNPFITADHGRRSRGEVIESWR